MAMDDEQIIELLWQRQEGGLQELKLKYERLCRRTARNILPNPEDTAECLNDVWFALWQLIPPQRPRNLAAFLLRVVRNLALKRYAYNTAARRSPEASLPLDELAEILPGGLAPEEELNSRRLLAAIEKFLRQQSRLNRQIFLRRYWYFDTVGEIAAQAGLSGNAAAARLCRLRGSLRSYLQKEGFDI